MILYQYLAIHASFSIFLIVKILCKIVGKRRSLMHEKHTTLKSIPENNENEDKIVKWVPKKKHEILKAKYKCLKKLFQIYDASVIGILPETEPSPEEPNRRHRRSYRTKTDACAGTSENSSGDVTLSDDTIIATAVMKELKLNLSTSNLEKTKPRAQDNKYTQDSKENVSVVAEKFCDIEHEHAQKLLSINHKRKPTRFQCFIQRLLGISVESGKFQYDTKVYAASDNNITYRYEKRRRRVLQFRRVRRLNKIHSESGLKETKNPVILSYVQSIQRNCLLDTTQRQCPILGCQMMFYGIINYNDHLNLCHFLDKKYICHYCHEGFVKEHDKIVHENEHIGITKLTTTLPTPAVVSTFTNTTNDTQTEVVEDSKAELPDDKLKKIVAFFEKIQDPDKIIASITKSRLSEMNMKKQDGSSNDVSVSDTTKTDKSASSCMNLQNQSLNAYSRTTSDWTPKKPSTAVKCTMCGESFDFRRQLSLHVDLEHRVHDKFSKFHSCAGIVNRSEDNEEKSIEMSSTESEISKISECSVVRCEPSTNIVYYTSTETICKKPSVVNSFVQKVRTGFCYKWEPGTKIIRV